MASQPWPSQSVMPCQPTQTSAPSPNPTVSVQPFPSFSYAGAGAGAQQPSSEKSIPSDIVTNSPSSCFKAPQAIETAISTNQTDSPAQSQPQPQPQPQPVLAPSNQWCSAPVRPTVSIVAPRPVFAPPPTTNTSNVGYPSSPAPQFSYGGSIPASNSPVPSTSPAPPGISVSVAPAPTNVNTIQASQTSPPPGVTPTSISTSTFTSTSTSSSQSSSSNSTTQAPSVHTSYQPYPTAWHAQGPWQRPPFAPYPVGYVASYTTPLRPVNLPPAAGLNRPQHSSALPSAVNLETQPIPPGVNPPSHPEQVSTQPAASSKPNSSRIDSKENENQDGEQKSKDDSNDALKNVEANSWTAHKTEDGTVYYYNAMTGESTYNRPPGFKAETERITSQPTPVSWEKLTGTDWAAVTTNDGKKYYYNMKNQATSWQIPSEIADLRMKIVQEVSAKVSVSQGQPLLTTDKGLMPTSSNLPAATTGGRESVGQKNSAALDLIKKKLQDYVVPNVSSPLTSTSNATVGTGNGSSLTEGAGKSQPSQTSIEKTKGSQAETNISESSSESDDEEVGPTKEECICQFKDMLKEKGVAPFSKWEKELPKIIFDPRFKAIPSYTERRAIFDHYVRTRADEERKEKRAALKAAVEGFKQLLDEASGDITHKTEYGFFAKRYGQDSRFQALERKDRESLLNERVLPLKKAVEDKVKAIQAASVASFKAMLHEKIDINSCSRWSRVKDLLRNDPRYKAVKREDRENLFNDYVSEMRKAELEAEKATKAKREEEEKLKERKREMLKRKEREEQEMERVRVKARRKDAVASYQALLTEKIKDPEASWTESRVKLEKDPLGRASNPELDPADLERLFREHVHGLYERCVRDYRSLLVDVITVDSAAKELENGKNVLSSWSDAKHLLRTDPRYTKTPRREREIRWKRHVEDIHHKIKLNESERADDRQKFFDGHKLPSKDGSRSSPAQRKVHR